MTSIAEILTLLLILICILILPRMFRQEKQAQKNKLEPRNFSVYMRLGIVASILLPVISALVIKPWKEDIILFVAVGLLPIAAGWGIMWTVSGLKKK